MVTCIWTDHTRTAELQAVVYWRRRGKENRMHGSNGEEEEEKIAKVREFYLLFRM